MSLYSEKLREAIETIAQHPDVVFLGQALLYKGTSQTRQFVNVDRTKIIEMPVTEALQMGMAAGMALAGYIPVQVFPRFNFMALAASSLTNFIDKLPEISGGKAVPKTIIKICVGSEKPLFPGVQHVGDFSDVYELYCRNVDVVRLTAAEMIVPAYEAALRSPKSTILVEYGDSY